MDAYFQIILIIMIGIQIVILLENVSSKNQIKNEPKVTSGIKEKNLIDEIISHIIYDIYPADIAEKENEDRLLKLKRIADILGPYGYFRRGGDEK